MCGKRCKRGGHWAMYDAEVVPYYQIMSDFLRIARPVARAIFVLVQGLQEFVGTAH